MWVPVTIYMFAHSYEYKWMYKAEFHLQLLIVTMNEHAHFYNIKYGLTRWQTLKYEPKQADLYMSMEGFSKDSDSFILLI